MLDLKKNDMLIDIQYKRMFVIACLQLSIFPYSINRLGVITKSKTAVR